MRVISEFINQLCSRRFTRRTRAEAENQSSMQTHLLRKATREISTAIQHPPRAGKGKKRLEDGKHKCYTRFIYKKINEKNKFT